MTTKTCGKSDKVFVSGRGTVRASQLNSPLSMDKLGIVRPDEPLNDLWART